MKLLNLIMKCLNRDSQARDISAQLQINVFSATEILLAISVHSFPDTREGNISSFIMLSKLSGVSKEIKQIVDTEGWRALAERVMPTRPFSIIDANEEGRLRVPLFLSLFTDWYSVDVNVSNGTIAKRQQVTRIEGVKCFDSRNVPAECTDGGICGCLLAAFVCSNLISLIPWAVYVSSAAQLATATPAAAIAIEKSMSSSMFAGIMFNSVGSVCIPIFSGALAHKFLPVARCCADCCVYPQKKLVEERVERPIGFFKKNCQPLRSITSEAEEVARQRVRARYHLQ